VEGKLCRLRHWGKGYLLLAGSAVVGQSQEAEKARANASPKALEAAQSVRYRRQLQPDRYKPNHSHHERARQSNTHSFVCNYPQVIGKAPMIKVLIVSISPLSLNSRLQQYT